MIYSFANNKQNNLFPRDELVLGTKDRRSKVSDKQLLTFPFNAIGWIKSGSKLSNSNKSNEYAKGTGFLISQSLVLTSAHNFVIRDEYKGEVIQYVPLSFSTLEPGSSGLVEKINSIKVLKLNFDFVGLVNRIVILKNMYFNQQEAFQQKYLSKILDLEKQSNAHDFALLKLARPIKRSQYFTLSPNLDAKCELAVTGYVNYYGNAFGLFIHSNVLNSIDNGTIDYDIDTDGGQSGCPVYIVQGNQVVGIHKAHSTQTHLNYATMITQQVIAVLKSWASQMDSSFGEKLNQNPTSQLNSENGEKKKKIIEQINYLREKGNQLKNLGQFEKALYYYNRLLDSIQKNIGNESLEYAKTLGCIGWINKFCQKQQQSLKCYIKELQIYQTIQQHESLQKAQALTNISNLYRQQNKIKQAKEYYKSAVNNYKRIGSQQIKCPDHLNSIGKMYNFQDKIQLALEFYGKAVIIYEKAGIISVGWANTYHNIGTVYYINKNLKQALKYFQLAMTIYQDIGKELIYWASILYNIGLVHKDSNKFQQAVEYFNKSLSIHQKIGRQSHLWVKTLKQIGKIYTSQGLLQKANQFKQKSNLMKDKLKQL